MSLKCGIVGLPNVGKSTLFNALTKAGIAAENYPFCTIEPNVGVVEVPDPRLDKLAEIRGWSAEEADRITTEGVSYRTTTGFNVAAVAVIAILIALYATWW